MRLRPPYPVSRALPVLLGALILGAVLPVIVATYLINRANADALLSARAELLVDGLENTLTGLLDPVAMQFEAARDHIETEGLSLTDAAAFEPYIQGLLTGAPQLSGAGVIRPDGTMRRWESGRPGAIEEPREALPLVDEALAATSTADKTVWAAPFVSLVLGDVILNPRIGLKREGGVLVGGVTGGRLSDYVAALSDEKVTAFVLYDRTGLIAYPGRLQETRPPQSTSLPTIAASSNPVLRDIWKVQNPVTQTSQMTNTQGHWARVEGVAYGYYYREIAGYGPANLMVGVAIPSAESWMFRWAASIGAGIGGLLLIAALITGTLVARRVARPFVQFDDALGEMQNMNFDKVALPDMARSPIAELATSAERLTTAACALARINHYLPRALAQRLMHSPDDAAQASERDVTVMFIDLEGFSAFAASRSAAETAAFLNALFAVIGPVIEENGGVIDKYTGDGLMAFWGAPEAQPDHAARAVRAACLISDTLSGAPGMLAVKDAPRLRIGLHSGPAIVGNLGFEGRVNYTLVGQTVNRAERVEQGLRGVRPSETTIIGLSGEMWDRFGPFDDVTRLEDVETENGPVLAVKPACGQALG